MATIQGVYVALFGRPADPTGLAYFNSVTNNGANLSAIGNLAGQAEYTARFAGLNNLQIINSIYQSLFGRDADITGLNFFANQLATGRQTINTIAINILDGATGSDLTTVNNKIAAANLYTAALDTGPEVVAYSGTAAADAGRAFIAGVTTTVPTTAAVDTAVAAMVSGPGAGTTYTLTKDIQSLTGTASGDTFIATIDAAANSPTLNTGDEINGGAGNDTLRITSVTNDTPVVTLNSVEKVQIQQLTGDSGAISAANWTGVTEIANVNSTGSVSVTGLAANAKITVANGAANKATNVTFADSKLGTTATVALDVSATGTKAASHTVKVATGGTDVVTGVTINATGANFVKYQGTDNKATSLTVTGSGTLNLTQNAAEFGKLATINASTNTGGLTFDASAVTATTLAVTGGSGKDVITANSTAAETIDLGAGDDTLSIGSGSNVTTADTYKGGDGTDTLNIATAANANTLVTAKANAQFTGFEVLGLTTVDANVDISKWSANSLTVAGDVTTADRTVSGFTSGATVTLTRDGDLANVLKVGITGATDAGTPNDTLNLALNADLTANRTYKVGVDGINILNISANDPDATTSTGVYTLTLSNANNVREINVSGASALSLDASGFGGSEGVTLKDTGTGNLTFKGTALGDNITGGSGVNTITGGDGKDNIDISASAAKADSIILTGIKAAANADTITGFVAGATAVSDKVTVDSNDTKVATGAGNAVFENATTAATVVNANQAVSQYNVTATKDVIEIGNAALGTNGDLSKATDGSELLKALASSGTASGITAATALGGDTVYFVAYQGGNAYLYYGNDAGGTAGLFEASEITLVGTFKGVAAGAFAQNDFVLV